MNNHRGQIAELRLRYENELFENVIPFWLRFSPDMKNGGHYDCLDRDGSVYDGVKHMWLQGRLVWMFSKLYRTVEQRPEWIETARHGMKFLREKAFRPDDGRVYFSLTADGRPIYLQRKIFTECFYVMALSEFGKATGEAIYVEEAKREFSRVMEWAWDWTLVGRPSLPGATPSRSLAVPMILLNLIDELSDGDPRAYAPEVDDCVRRMLLHVDTAGRVVRENVMPDGSPFDTPEGRLLNPGHAIEAGWFLQRWAGLLGRADLRSSAIDIVRWSFDKGWDAEHGGLFYFLDAGGFSPTQLEWPMKLWWPHCEAMYASLLNWSLTGDERDWDMFEKVDAYSFSHFRDPEYGEWYGYLDRYGNVTHRFKGGPYKGAFHVPRALWLCWSLLKKIEAGQ